MANLMRVTRFVWIVVGKPVFYHVMLILLLLALSLSCNAATIAVCGKSEDCLSLLTTGMVFFLIIFGAFGVAAYTMREELGNYLKIAWDRAGEKQKRKAKGDANG